jgi:hypothetical protein
MRGKVTSICLIDHHLPRLEKAERFREVLSKGGFFPSITCEIGNSNLGSAHENGATLFPALRHSLLVDAQVDLLRRQGFISHFMRLSKNAS